jgi:hypothetical protein
MYQQTQTESSFGKPVTVISEPNGGFNLIIDPNRSRDDPKRIIFADKTSFPKAQAGGSIVTGRELERYPPKVREIPYGDPIAEIGTGLGGFCEHIHLRRLSQGTSSKQPITIIDPFNYNMAEEMLRMGAEFFQDDYGLNEHILGLAKRANLYGTKLRHVPLPLSKALTSFPDLKGTFEWVVDAHCSGNHYMLEDEYGSPEQMISQGKTLLNPELRKREERYITEQN